MTPSTPRTSELGAKGLESRTQEFSVDPIDPVAQRSLTSVRGLDTSGGSYRIQGQSLPEKANREGAFLIESDALSVGLELEQDGTKIRLLDAKRWFEQQPDDGSDGRNTARPSDGESAIRRQAP